MLEISDMKYREDKFDVSIVAWTFITALVACLADVYLIADSETKIDGAEFKDLVVLLMIESPFSDWNL
jgi:hypothetical protein